MRSRRDATKALEVCEQSLDTPTSFVATELASILMSTTWTFAAAFGRNQVDSTFGPESLLERRGVPSFIADQAGR